MTHPEIFTVLGHFTPILKLAFQSPWSHPLKIGERLMPFHQHTHWLPNGHVENGSSKWRTPRSKQVSARSSYLLPTNSSSILQVGWRMPRWRTPRATKSAR